MRTNYIPTTIKEAQANLDELCNAAVSNGHVIIINRPNGPDVALIAADELSCFIETLYLLSSPLNALRLIAALKRVQRG